MGGRRLKHQGHVHQDGRLIDDSIVGREQHWTESFRAVDWNGDGKPDLVGAMEWGLYPFICHAALEMERHPDYSLGSVTV